MKSKSINDIISEIKLIQTELQHDSEIVAKLESLISELKKHDKFSLDKNLDRSKKISEILAVLSKILFDFFKSP